MTILPDGESSFIVKQKPVILQITARCVPITRGSQTTLLQSGHSLGYELRTELGTET